MGKVGSKTMLGHAFIVGGTGEIGRAVASNLLEHGCNVTLLHRGRQIAPARFIERGAKVATLDRNEPCALATVIRKGADAVIDTVAFTAEHGRQLVALDDTVGTFVVVSSASVYRDAAGRTLDEARKNGFPDLPVPALETGRLGLPAAAERFSARLLSRSIDGHGCSSHRVQTRQVSE